MRSFFVTGVLLAVAAHAGAQSFQRRAAMVGGGRPDHQKCTIEVVVDGAAEVEVRGDNAVLRNLNGQPAQWRRFECTAPMPTNPAGFRFAGVDGRGRQDLVRDPRNGSAAVVRIEDRDNGSEGYTFDLFWVDGPGGGYQGGQSGGRDDRGGGFGGDDRGGFRGGDRGPDYRNRDWRRNPFTTQEAINVCQNAVRDQAYDRYRTRNVRFRNTSIDDNPGRRDWVIGNMEVESRRGRFDLYRFSCSVDFSTGRVRSADIQTR